MSHAFNKDKTNNHKIEKKYLLSKNNPQVTPRTKSTLNAFSKHNIGNNIYNITPSPGINIY